MLEAQLVYQLTRHLVSKLLIILSMPQMRRNYVKVAVLKREVVGDAPFVANVVHHSFGYLRYAHVGRLLEQIALNEAEQEHLVHLEELVGDRNEATRSHVDFDFTGALGFKLARALLHANRDDIVLFDLFDEVSGSHESFLVLAAHIPCNAEKLEISGDSQLAFLVLLTIWRSCLLLGTCGLVFFFGFSGKVEQLCELMLLVHGFKDELDIDELALDQVELDQTVVGHAEVHASYLLAREYLFSVMGSRIFLLSNDPKGHISLEKMAILSQHRLRMDQAVLLLAVPKEDHLKFEAWRARLIHTLCPEGRDPGCGGDVLFERLLLSLVLVGPRLCLPHVVQHPLQDLILRAIQIAIEAALQLQVARRRLRGKRLRDELPVICFQAATLDHRYSLAETFSFGLIRQDHVYCLNLNVTLGCRLKAKDGVEFFWF